MRAFFLPLFALSAMPCAALASCIGTTGGDLIDFPAAAAGPSDAVLGQPFVFDTDKGWHVVLTKARLHVGALYLDESAPVSGVGNTPCILPGTYIAQVTTGMDVDLLSPQPVLFPAPAHGTTGFVRLAQVWLTGGDINAVDDTTVLLALEGSAERAGDLRPFTAAITIDSSRTGSGESAGGNPPCKQRIVSLPTKMRVDTGGGLLLRIDPRQLFNSVNFQKLQKASDGVTYAFQSNDNDDASSVLYSNLKSAGSLYTFRWVASANELTANPK